jgi:hypothetical protein
MSHIIRLHGPWQVVPLARYTRDERGAWSLTDGPLPPPATIIVPTRWDAALGPDFNGAVRWTRRFHRPTGLSAGDRVWLALDLEPIPTCVELNNHRLWSSALGADPLPRRLDITDRLLPSNLLSLDASNPPDTPPAELRWVALEIEVLSSTPEP